MIFSLENGTIEYEQLFLRTRLQINHITLERGSSLGKVDESEQPENGSLRL